MRRLKEFYLHNSIAQFLVSYIMVLIIPLFALWYGFQSAFWIVEEDIKQSNIAMLDHSMSLIDNQVEAMASMALQTSQSQAIREFASYDGIEPGYYDIAKRCLEQFYNLMRYQSIPLLGEPYIYFIRRDMVMYDNSYYRPEIFKRYVNQWGMTMEEWRLMCGNDGSRTPKFVPAGDNSFAYVLPFSNKLMGEAVGVVAYQINTAQLGKLLDFENRYEQYSLFITDENGRMLWMRDDLGRADRLPRMDPVSGGFTRMGTDGSGFTQMEDDGYVYTVSKKTGWNYLLVVPEKDALNRLTVLKNLVFVLIGGAVLFGVFISLTLSIKKGRPINEIFRSVTQAGRAPQGYQKLGEAVTGILQDHQELLQEVEQDRPLLQKAFFHDLIKAEFENDAELQYMAAKAGISMSGNSYRVASFKLFVNNDFYEADEQTIEEVHIISQLLERHIAENYKEPVYFYKKNYLTNLAIIPADGDSDLWRLVLEQTSHWIREEYSVETVWGISSVCTDLLFLWKAAEEASTAMESCKGACRIMEYQAGLQGDGDFYFPEIAQEKMASGIRSGDYVRVEDILYVLEKENFINRRLSRSQFIKFNRRVTDTLSLPELSGEEGSEKLLWLNEVVIDTQGQPEEYFKRLRQIVSGLCKQVNDAKNRQKGHLIDRIMEYMQENYMDSGLGLAKVGSIFGVSEGYLSSIFKERAGINFADFLETIRIEKACLLLQDEKNTVNDIARMVGYNSVQSFRRAFKRAKGVSPRDARPGSR